MKQSRLLEIIREEISAVLHEGEAEDKAAKAAELKAIDAKQKALDAEKKDTMKGGALEEDQLNEMAYNIVLSNPTELAKLKDKIKDSTKKGEQLLSQVIDIIQRDKKEDKPIRQRDIANELGTIQQKINPLVNLLIDYGILSKGESVTGVTKKTPSDKPKKEKPAKAEKAPKVKAAMVPKAEPMDDVDDEGNKIEIDTTIKTPTGDKTIEDKLKSVIAAKKTKLKAAKKGSPEFEKELTALTQFLNGKEISKYIKKKSVEGSNPYLISNILKDIE